MIFFV